MLSDERIRQIAEEYWSSTCGTRVPDMEKAIRAALAEAAQVMGEAVALREFADEVKQLCKDFSDQHNRPYMGDVTAAIDGLLAQFVAGQTSHATQAELDALRKDAERMQKALSDIAEWTDRYTTPGHPISTIARAAIAKEKGK